MDDAIIRLRGVAEGLWHVLNSCSSGNDPSDLLALLLADMRLDLAVLEQQSADLGRGVASRQAGGDAHGGRPMSAWQVVLGLGALVVLVSALADVLRIGGEPGFGYKQGAGVFVGIALIIAGVLCKPRR